MFINIFRYLTFSIKLYAFYEIFRASAHDFFFIIVMFLLMLLTYALIGVNVFGTTDKNYSTIEDTLFSLFLMLLGDFYTIKIETLSKTIKHIYGISYIIVTVILLNILVAIIGTHYFEFYVEQGANPNNMLKIIIRFIIDRHKKIENANKTWFQKLKNRIFNKLDQWMTIVIEDEINTATNVRIVTRTNDNDMAAIPFGFMDYVDLVNSDKTKGMYRNSNMGKMHFWVTLLDHAISKTIRQGYFERLYNDQSLFQSPSDRFFQNYVNDPNFDYKYLKFIM